MLVSIDGRRTYYDLAGPDDAPVVAMGHSLASDSGMWGEQMAPLLGAGFRVLRIDSRGHGGSDGPKSDYTMDQLADDIAAVIRALGIDRVHYVGLSIGGMFVEWVEGSPSNVIGLPLHLAVRLLRAHGIDPLG